MPQPNRKRYRLSQVVQEVRDTKPGFEIEGEGGALFTVPPPELWPDTVLELANSEPLTAAQIVLGDQYQAYREAGGSAALLFHIVSMETGVPLGESAAS